MSRKESLLKNINHYFDARYKKSFYFDFFIFILILIIGIIYILETYSYFDKFSKVFFIIDYTVIVIFTIEFFARLHYSKRKINFFKSPYTYIDLLAIVPFWIGFGNLLFFRVFRILKFFKYSLRYLNYDHGIFSKKHIERIFITRIIFLLICMLYVSAGLVYFFEKDLNSQINTFGDAMYFTIVTITTVGFGDITPQTATGKVITMFVIIGGILIIPWQIGSLIKFLMFSSKKRKIVCKKCGLKYHDPDAVFCKACGAVMYHEDDGDSLFIK